MRTGPCTAYGKREIVEHGSDGEEEKQIGTVRLRNKRSTEEKADKYRAVCVLTSLLSHVDITHINSRSHRLAQGCNGRTETTQKLALWDKNKRPRIKDRGFVALSWKGKAKRCGDV